MCGLADELRSACVCACEDVLYLPIRSVRNLCSCVFGMIQHPKIITVSSLINWGSTWLV